VHHHIARLVLLVATPSALLRCATPAHRDGGADIGAPLDGPIDAAPADTAPDAPAEPPASCDPCVYDESCGPGGLCDELDPMTAPSLRTCLAACAQEGAECSARGVPGMCEQGLSGLVCRPRGRCVGSARNAACPASGCVGRYSVCARAPGPVCLSPCTRDSECENGFSRCREVPLTTGGSARVCVEDDPVGPDQCGRRAVNARGVGAPCAAGCAAGLSCASAIAATAPAFCSMPCEGDATCGPNAHCAVLTEGRRCVPDDCGPFERHAEETLLDRALRGASRARSELFYSRADLGAFANNVINDRFRLPIFNRVHRDWIAGARWARGLGPALDARASTLSGALAAAASLRQDGDPGSIPSGSPVAANASLEDAIVALDAAAGGSIDPASVRAELSSVPDALQRAIAPVVSAMVDAFRARNAGLRGPWSREERERLHAIAHHQILAGVDALNPRDGRDLGVLLGDVVLPVQASLALARTIEETDWNAFRGRSLPPCTIETAAGVVSLRGGGADRYESPTFDRVALAVDLGGDDRYLAPVAANQGLDNAVSVLIDLDGADEYSYPEVPHPVDAMGFLPSDRAGRASRERFSYSEVPRQGSGRLGVALLYDLGAGADRYRTLRGGQGFGALGIGGLFDEGGDDRYELEAGGQGAAVLGVGVLVDAAGQDTYSAWAYAQGFGYVRGVGVLHDRDGADAYSARETPVAYPSAQNPRVNGSFSQGAGFGRRADFSDNIHMSGGIGVLRDRAGDDRYTASIFAQGTGYWGGMGLLLDGAGADRYDARWYVQGGAAHFAYAALVDGGGADIHNMSAERQNMTAGAGHDFSLGLLLADGDEGDVYNVPNLALGAGNANGAGFFADAGGRDTYRASSSLSLGNAAYENLMDTGRLMRRTWGLFLDGAGEDTYERPSPGPVQNDSVWTQRIHDEAPNETGLGADGTAPLGL
jgi:hypothetical protein